MNEAWLKPELAETWKTLIAVKGEVAKAIETARQNKVLGHSLDAAVVIGAPEKLRTLFWRSTGRTCGPCSIVSDVRIVADAGGDRRGLQKRRDRGPLGQRGPCARGRSATAAGSTARR